MRTITKTMKHIKTISLFLFAAAGLLVSATLLVWFYAPALSLAGLSCSGSEGCGKIAGSGFSSFFGIPVALYGMFFYIFMLVTLAVRQLSPRELDRCWLVMLAAVSILSVLVDAGLAIIMMKTGFFCKFCLLTYALNIAICVLLVPGIASGVKISGSFTGYLSLDRFRQNRAYATIAILYCIIILMSIPSLDSINITIKNFSTGRYSSQKLIDKTVSDAYSKILVQSELPETYMVEGGMNAQVKIVVFTDFLCSACRQWHDIAKRLLRDFRDDISIRYYVFPLDVTCNGSVSRTVYRNSCSVNSAMIMGSKQGLFTEMSDYNFTGLKSHAQNVRDGNLSFYDDFLKGKGVMGDYKSDQDIKRILMANISAGKARGVSSTPYIYINGHPVDGVVPYEAFHRIVERELSKK